VLSPIFNLQGAWLGSRQEALSWFAIEFADRLAGK
jgi:hypothetical protein